MMYFVKMFFFDDLTLAYVFMQKKYIYMKTISIEDVMIIWYDFGDRYLI